MNWPSVLMLLRHQSLVATSVPVAILVAVLVAGASVLLRHVLKAAVVATAWCCRDSHSAQLLSRHPDVVATSSLYNCCRDILMLSRPLLSLKRTSRQLTDVATSWSLQLV